MGSPVSPVRRIEWCLLLLAGTLSSLWCLTAARELGATFDEPVYLREGLQRWRSGSMAGLLKLGTMPLPVDVQTLPLHLWEKFHGTTIDPDRDFDKVIPYARGFTLLFWWLLLLHVMLAARSLGGPWAGAIAVIFVAFEPSLVAHAALATTDIAAAACLVALLYHFHQQRDRGWWRRVAWPGLWFGLALLAKASGLVFGGLCLVAVESVRCNFWRGDDRARFRASFRDLVQIGMLGMLVTFVYCGSDWEPQRSFLAWTRTLPAGSGRNVMGWIAEHLCIFPNAGDGIARQFGHNVRGHGSYLLGETHPRAFWYYFPVLLTIKLTVPLLLGVVVFGVRRLVQRETRLNWALHAASALLLFSPLCRVQVGIRFMFPLIVLLIVGLSALLVESLREATPLRRRLMAGLSAGAAAWVVVGTALVWPHGMCYVNPLWGGTEDGYRLVSEGNYDWGQGIKELVRLQEKHRDDKLDAWVFTSDPVVARMPMHHVPLHTMPISSDEDFLSHVRGRRLAVSVTFLHGAHVEPPFLAARRVLRDRRPVAQTTMYRIYDFTSEADSTSARR